MTSLDVSEEATLVPPSAALSSVPTTPGTLDVLRLAVLVGVFAGFAEGAVLKIGSRLLHLPTGGLAPLELFWFAPLAASTSLLIIAVLLLALNRALSPVLKRSLAAYAFPVFVAVAVYSFTRSLRLGIAAIAAIVLAAGIAMALTRLIKGDRAVRAARRGVPWIVGLLVLYAIAIPMYRRSAERRALAALPAAGATPNVLVVVWDAVRQFNLSLYGYDRPTTPELERFAARGVVYDRAFTTSSWSLPSHASMLTGHYPHQMTAGHRQPLDQSLPMISAVLAKRGYATGGFVANPYWMQPEFGLSRGFTTWDPLPATTPGTIASTWWLSKSTWETINAWRDDHRDLVRRRATHVNRELISWVERRGDRPFFAFLNYFDAHEPYRPPAPFDTLFARPEALDWTDDIHRDYSPQELADLRDVYDEGIRYLDAQFKNLLDQLQALGELDNTIVIVTSDHGEEFGERGPSMISHSLTLHTTSTLIPMVVVYPPRLPAGARVAAPVSLVDLPATILDLTGAGNDTTFPGVSLARYVADSAAQATSSPRVMMIEKRKKTGNLPPWSANYGNVFAVVDGNLHYILDAEGKDQLFDLSHDLWERNNLAGRAEMQESLQRMKALLDSLVRSPDGTLRPRVPMTGRAFGGGKFMRRR